MEYRSHKKDKDVIKQPSWRDKQRAVREEAILDAVQDLMSQMGYADMSMDDVANHVGISKATLYQHFGSKEDLAVHAIVRSMKRIVQLIQEQDTSHPAIERLEQMMLATIHQRYAHKRVTRTGPRPMLLGASLYDHPLYQEINQILSVQVDKLVNEAKAQGDIDPQYPTKLITQVLFSTIRTPDYQFMLQMGDVTSDVLEQTIISMLFYGLRTRKA